jgi:ankyrin repeat protein
MNKSKKNIINKKHKKTYKKKILKNKTKNITKHRNKKKLTTKKHKKTFKNKIKGGTIEDDLYRLFTNIIIDIQNNDLEGIKGKLEKNPDIINYRVGEHKATLLQQAVLYDKPDVVKLLIDSGADINLFDDRDSTPLIMAILENKNDLANILIDRGANLNMKDIYGRTPLHFAAQKKNSFVLQKLLENPEIKIESMDSVNVSPLSYAATFGDIDCIRILLDNGANINSEDINSWTPLFYAVQYGKIDAVKLLIDRGANILKKNKFGNTLLHLACKRNNYDMVKFLLEIGAAKTINDRDNVGLTALIYAVDNQNFDVVKLLIENGADIALKDNNGNSALKLSKDPSEINTFLKNKAREIIHKKVTTDLIENQRQQEVLQNLMSNINAELLIREEERLEAKKVTKKNKQKLAKQRKNEEKTQKEILENQLKREKEENDRVAKETELFSREENFQKEQQLHLQELEKQQEIERNLQEKQENEEKEANELLEKQIQQAMEESKKTFNSEQLQIEVLSFWTHYFESEENIKNVKNEIAKMKLLEGNESFEKLKEILPAYSNKFISKDPATNNIISLLFILIGILSNTLINNRIYLILKGGSAIQNVGSQVPNQYIVPYESNDIDIVLINTNNITNNIRNIDENKNIAEQISKFLIWVTEVNSNSILTKTTNTDSTHPIFKIIFNNNNINKKPLPLMDIDYNNLPDDMYNLYMTNIYSKPFNLGGQISGIFNSPSIINLIYERFYYLVKYSTKEEVKNFKSKSFLSGKIPKSLNYLVKLLFIIENTREIEENEVIPFYHGLFNEFFNMYPILNANYEATHDYTIDQLIEFCIS